jgi:putative alpha-1,2-mannosidase
MATHSGSLVYRANEWFGDIFNVLNAIHQTNQQQKRRGKKKKTQLELKISKSV